MQWLQRSVGVAIIGAATLGATAPSAAVPMIANPTDRCSHRMRVPSLLVLLAASAAVQSFGAVPTADGRNWSTNWS